ncbi:MAG: biotin synthase BioB, partial [Muribaculaceae bacterium]|nr:biotin synthase BioB [Muribaculaceae bacterium]
MQDNNDFLSLITERVLDGGEVSHAEAVRLASWPDLDALCDAADRICRATQSSQIDSCSIVNARSGMCGEDCKW